MDTDVLVDPKQQAIEEWMPPGHDYPVVPSSEDNRKLMKLEERARAAVALLGAIPELVGVGRKEIEVTGGTNVLYFYASSQFITIEQRTPFWRLLEGRIVIELPPFFDPE